MNLSLSSSFYSSTFQLFVYIILFIYIVARVLKAVDFHRRFDELPQYIPTKLAEAGTPLPLSPLDIVNSFRNKRKQSTGISYHKRMWMFFFINIVIST